MKRFFINIIGIMLCALTFVACSDDDKAGMAAPIIAEFAPTEGVEGDQVIITGEGFGASRQDGHVYFNGIETAEYLNWSDNTITVTVPKGMVTGHVAVRIGGGVTVNAPGMFEYNSEGAIEQPDEDNFNCFLNHLNVESLTGKCNPCSYSQPQGGSPIIYEHKYDIGYSEGYDSNSKVESFILWDAGAGDYTLFSVNIPKEDDYYLYFGTKGKSTDVIEFSAGRDKGNLTESKTVECKAEGYDWPSYEYKVGKFHLKPGKNYLRVEFLQTGLVLTDMHIMNKDVTDPGTGIEIIVPEEPKDYVKGLYAHDFDDNTLGLFKTAWSWEPSYAKAVNGYLEVHFDQAALDADNRRERKGAEVTCGFKTTSEGWYGFKIFLPTEAYPKNIEGSCIAQIFNGGNANTWAGHLKVNKEDLTIHYRGSAAASAEVTKTVGKLTWNKWIPIVVYFKAGRNNKGNIKVWMGDDIAEAKPTFDSGNINFAFGNWITDNILDDKDNGDYKGASLGGKWGLYVASGGDRTIRFDDLKILSGNPDGAFDIVKP